MKKDGNGKRRWVIVACTVLGAIFVLFLGISARAAGMLKKINYVDPACVPTLSQEELDRLLEEDREAANRSQKQLAADLLSSGGDDGVINILLIGQDKRAGQSRARSDAMILCTVQPEQGRLVLTSFLRDLWVKIPGYRDNRLNAAYAAGGMKLLDKTLEKNFGIRVDANVDVDFSRFAQIIDLLGGVEIDLRSDEARHINRTVGGTLKEGCNTLSGAQALCYARIRKLDPDADFSRTNRQRKILDALAQKYREISLPAMLELLDEVLPMVTTDMSRQQVLSYARVMFAMLGNLEIVSQRIPADGAYSTPVINGMAVIVADMDAARRLLQEIQTD